MTDTGLTNIDPNEEELARMLRSVHIDDEPRDEHRRALREQALAQFDRAAVQVVIAPQPRRTWRELLARRSFASAICAALLLVVAGVWLLVPVFQSRAHAFQAFAAALIEARTARFHAELETEGQPKQTAKAYYLAPGRMRLELSDDLVSIIDGPGGKMVNLSLGQKQAMVFNVAGEKQPTPKSDFFETTLKLLSENRYANEHQFVSLGEKQIDGVRALGFRFENPLTVLTVWGDPATGRPLQIENTFTGVPRSTAVMTGFELNLQLDEKLFDTNPPADFAVQSFDVDSSQATEADLIKAFEIGAELNGGQFPEALDFAGIQQAVTTFAQRIGGAPSEQQMQELTAKLLTIGRGLTFMSELPESADAHYAGKGVAHGTAGRPIFWYKPAGSDKYRVIEADLTVKIADAPDVADAMRIAPSPTTPRPNPPPPPNP